MTKYEAWNSWGPYQDFRKLSTEVLCLSWLEAQQPKWVSEGKNYYGDLIFNEIKRRGDAAVAMFIGYKLTGAE